MKKKKQYVTPPYTYSQIQMAKNLEKYIDELKSKEIDPIEYLTVGIVIPK